MADDHSCDPKIWSPLDCLAYDPARLGWVRDFDSCPQVKAMIMTVRTINRNYIDHLGRSSGSSVSMNGMTDLGSPPNPAFDD